MAYAEPSLVRKLPGLVSFVLASPLSRRAKTSGSEPSMVLANFPPHCRTHRGSVHLLSWPKQQGIFY